MKVKKMIIIALCLFALVESTVRISAVSESGETDVHVRMIPGKDEEAVDPGENLEGGNSGGGNAGTSSYQIWLKPIVFGFEAITFNDVQDMIARIDTSANSLNTQNKPVTVFDGRANESGWSLSASMPKLVDIKGEAQDITNARIEFEQVLGDWSIDTVSGGLNHRWNPNSEKVDIEKGANTINRSPQVIISAKKETGKGYQGTMLKNIKLVIPSGSGKEGVSYKGTIYWSLDDTPGQ